MGEKLVAVIMGGFIGVAFVLGHVDSSVQKQCDTIERLELNGIAYSCIKMPKPLGGE